MKFEIEKDIKMCLSCCQWYDNGDLYEIMYHLSGDKHDPLMVETPSAYGAPVKGYKHPLITLRELSTIPPNVMQRLSRTEVFNLLLRAAL